MSEHSLPHPLYYQNLFIALPASVLGLPAHSSPKQPHQSWVILVLLAKPWRLPVSVTAAVLTLTLSVKPFMFDPCCFSNGYSALFVSWSFSVHWSPGFTNACNTPIWGPLVLVHVECCSCEFLWLKLIHGLVIPQALLDTLQHCLPPSLFEISISPITSNMLYILCDVCVLLRKWQPEELFFAPSTCK